MNDVFYQQPTLILAQQLIGCTLIHQSLEGTTSGIIVETEAYLQDDPACHAYRRQTPRNAPMFGRAGTVYVYQIYGLHYCINVVSNKVGIGEAVLIRALEPLEGIDLMTRRRFGQNATLSQLKTLCKGPANLVKALGLHKDMNGWDLQNSDLSIDNQRNNTNFDLVTTTRIGITQGAELPYRFYVKGSSFVSK